MSPLDDSEPRSRVAELFAELCDLDAPERARRLREIAQQDAALGQRLNRLLEIDHDASGPLERVRGEVAAAAERGLLGKVGAPERLGPWQLGERLGAGGMGEVYRGERTDGGFEQRAAIKIVRAGMASESVVARFLIERQVLARLSHPAIARLLDGGLAPDGRPWFAMELVEGAPITEFAKEHHLSVEERLGLVIEVAQAVDFAHRSLVVHRDLKPSNILVTRTGEPKLLDFGLAKLLEPDADPGLTRTDVRALTPAYAAPEQVRGEPITTATDVYSLGVVLYELLTGTLPGDGRVASSGAVTVAPGDAAIERPSLRAGRDPADREGAARRARRLAGDVDTILLRALAREPARRYASAAALADDLRRHLEGRPVAARPDTRRYRLAKFVSRHRVSVAAAAGMLLSLLGGLAISLVQTERANASAALARLEAQRAERVKGFLVSVFEQADPTRTRGAEMPARQILAEGARRIGTELQDEPEVRAELHDTVARIQSSLGLLDDALASAETAVAERAELFGPRSLEHARSLVTLGSALMGLGRLDEAAERYEVALADFAAQGQTSSIDYARALSGRSQTRMLRGDLEGSRADETTAHALFATALGPDDPETLEHLSNLAVIETEFGTFAEAARIFRQILARLEPVENGDSAKVLEVVLNLATALDSAGQSEEALPLFERVVAGRRRIFGSGHPSLAEALVITSLRLSRAGRPEEALAALEEARATYAPLDHPELGSVDNYTGLVLADLGRFDEAERAFERASTRFARDLGTDSVLTVNALANEAHVVSEQGRITEAAAMFESAAAKLHDLGEFDNPRLLRMRLNWGANLRACGRYAEARQVLDAALALATEKLGAGHLRIAEGAVELARLDLAQDGVAAAGRARERLAAAERFAAGRSMSLAFKRNLAAARVELARVDMELAASPASAPPQ